MARASLESIEEFMSVFSTTALSPESTVGLVQFNHDLVRVQHPALAKEIDFSLEHTGGNRDSGSALKFVLSDILLGKKPMRGGVKVVVLILAGLPTDAMGKTSADIRLVTQNTAAALRQMGVELVLITVPSNGNFLQARASFTYSTPSKKLFLDLSNTLEKQNFLCGFDVYLPTTLMPTASEPTLRPSASPTQSPFFQRTSLPSASPSQTSIPSIAPSSISSSPFSSSPSASPQVSRPTSSPNFSTNPSASPTRLPSLLPSIQIPNVKDEMTFTPTSLPSLLFSSSPSASPSSSPSTSTPTQAPTFSPSSAPSTLTPTLSPTLRPSLLPTLSPSKTPTMTPTRPTKRPTTTRPTKSPTPWPTLRPSLSPTVRPSKRPISARPTKLPTSRPTTGMPTRRPTTLAPTTAKPTPFPSLSPTFTPSTAPSKSPSNTPTHAPSFSPSSAPTHGPSSHPSPSPSHGPTASPTQTPTVSPTQVPTSSPTPTPKQNVLMLLADDFKPLLKTFGSPFAGQMKNLDKLASESISFMNAHAQMAICGPSRASFLTSMRPDTTQIYGLGANVLHKYIKQSQGNKDLKEVLLLPKMFKESGYRTFGVGKVFHETEYNLFGDPDVWTEPMYSFVAGLSRPAVFTKPYQGSWISQPNVTDDFFSDGQAAILSARLIADVLSVPPAGSDEIQPWFLAVGLWKPHLPWSAPLKYFEMAGLYSNYPGLHHLNVRGLSDYQQYQAYGHGCGEVNLYSGSPKVLGQGPNAENQAQRGSRAYHATALYMDEQIGVIMDALNNSASRMDTIVIFFSDHGFHLGDHGLFGKHTNYEASTKVPLFIRPSLRYSHYQRGAKSYAPVELLDVMPTLYELARIPLDLSVYQRWEGVSLVPILNNPTTASVKMGAVSQYFRGAGALRRFGYSLRTTRYRLTNWWGTFQEFYDYLEDEWESSIVEDEPTKQYLMKTLVNARSSLAAGVPFDFGFADQMANKTAPLFP